MRALGPCAIALLAIACRIDLDQYEFKDAQPRLCTPQPTNATCAAAVGQNTLTFVQDKIIKPKCALSDSCHSDSNPQDMLDLSTAAKSHMLLVDQASILDPSRKLVVAGNVNASLLAAFIGGIKPSEAEPPLVELPHSANGDKIGTMPYNSTTMCCEKVDAFTAWIAAGAQNN